MNLFIYLKRTVKKPIRKNSTITLSSNGTLFHRCAARILYENIDDDSTTSDLKSKKKQPTKLMLIVCRIHLEFDGFKLCALHRISFKVFFFNSLSASEKTHIFVFDFILFVWFSMFVINATRWTHHRGCSSVNFTCARSAVD